MSWPCPLVSLWRPSFTNRLRDVSLPSHLSIILFSLALSLSFSFSRQSATKVLLTMRSFAVLHCVLRRLLIVGTLCLRILRLQLDGILYAGPLHFAIIGLLASRFCRVALLPVTGCFVVGLMLSIHCLCGRALRLFSFFSAGCASGISRSILQPVHFCVFVFVCTAFRTWPIFVQLVPLVADMFA